MTLERLREVATARPFRPFTICLADGRQFRVPSPESLMMSPQAQRTFAVAESDDDYRIFDLLLVTSLDFVRTRRTHR